MRIIICCLLMWLSAAQGKIVNDDSYLPNALAPAFVKSHPTICIDHGHANLSIDGGRYKPVIHLLESDGYRVVATKSKFDFASLQGCEILYISAARSLATDGHELQTSAFTDSEIAYVNKWVDGGGRLLVATDHPNMAQAAQSLIGSFGVKGSLSTTQDVANTIPILKDPAVIEFMNLSKGENSPITEGRNESEKLIRVVIFNGQSLESESGMLIFKFSRSATDLHHDHTSTPAFGRAAMVIMKKGKGRVAITGDATIFTSKIEDASNEKLGINRSGTDNVQLALNTFHWLSGILAP